MCERVRVLTGYLRRARRNPNRQPRFCVRIGLDWALCRRYLVRVHACALPPHHVCPNSIDRHCDSHLLQRTESIYLGQKIFVAPEEGM